MCIFARGNRLAALHCIVFGQVFPANPMNQGIPNSLSGFTLLILDLGYFSLIVTQFHFEANSGFGEPTANGDSCICRVWWLGWCTEEEDHGSGISLMQFWAPNLIDWAPHTSASSRAMIIRVLCKNVELINPMLQHLHICCFVSWQYVTYSEGRCNWVFEMRDGVTGDLDTGTWLMVTRVTTLLWSLHYLPTKLRCQIIGSSMRAVWFIPDSLCI